MQEIESSFVVINLGMILALTERKVSNLFRLFNFKGWCFGNQTFSEDGSRSDRLSLSGL